MSSMMGDSCVVPSLSLASSTTASASSSSVLTSFNAAANVALAFSAMPFWVSSKATSYARLHLAKGLLGRRFLFLLPSHAAKELGLGLDLDFNSTAPPSSPRMEAQVVMQAALKPFSRPFLHALYVVGLGSIRRAPLQLSSLRSFARKSLQRPSQVVWLAVMEVAEAADVARSSRLLGRRSRRRLFMGAEPVM